MPWILKLFVIVGKIRMIKDLIVVLAVATDIVSTVLSLNYNGFE